MRRHPIIVSSLLAITFAIASVANAGQSDIDLRGVWRPETYILNDGSQHVIDGLVFFSEKEWTFLVFVTLDGKPLRGEGEGGTYAWRGDELVFTHNYILLAGEEVGTLAETPLRMEIEDAANAATTACQVTLEEDRLTIQFGPSGNAMVFRRG